MFFTRSRVWQSALTSPDIFRRATKSDWARLCAVVATAGLSVATGAGLGGLTPAVLVVAVGGLTSSMGPDRLMWMVWWLTAWLAYSSRLALVIGECRGADCE